ncbi:hypothetical protein N7471_008228 [Penicillium samsonianum]|uniref:uncharacterized protein n=1 Tax=Penicillium samsonianum TaxID=1882272 RepID=UPI002548A539|nr:uncharacterized protein N7471_008228 [Penicillium samsonianum]KAJ6133013.1 hypothetical protein N7471_008228 [Penicillium samsonianum]
MDGLEVAPEQYRGTGTFDSEKEVRTDTAGLHYVSGPTSANPGILEDGSLKTKSPKEPKRICGVTYTVFWLLVAIAILVIGGAVGGGVGGSLANRKTTVDSSKPGLDATSTTSTEPQSSTATASSSTTTTASTTSSAPITSGTIGIAANPCPRQNKTIETGSDGSIFTLLCAVDWPRGGEPAYGNGRIKDLSTRTEYTLKSCIAQCVQWNQNTSNDPKCKGVVYSANLTASFDGGQGGNCFLKSNVGKYYPNSDTSMAAGILGG